MLTVYSLKILQTLEQTLKRNLPESLRVYSTIFHISRRNPLKLQVLVDRWPNFNTVIIRPQDQMTDNFDHYTNTYQIYSKDLGNLQEVLDLPGIINWKQHLQIQASQSSLNEVIKNVAASKSLTVSQAEWPLYIPLEMVKKLLPSLLSEKKVTPNISEVKDFNSEMLRASFLCISHAELVNQFWGFGGTEKSLKYIQHCIQHFPNICLLDPGRQLVSWVLTDQTGEMRMGATVPRYQGKDLMKCTLHMFTHNMENLSWPTYFHMRRNIMINTYFNLKHMRIPCFWNQWSCEPAEAFLEIEEQGDYVSQLADIGCGQLIRLDQ